MSKGKIKLSNTGVENNNNSKQSIDLCQRSMAHQLFASLPSLFSCSFSSTGGGSSSRSRSRPRPTVTVPAVSSSVVAKSTSTITTTITTTTGPVGVRAESKPAASANTDNTIVRRSADYRPAIWTFDHIQSLTNNYVGESYARRVNELKEQVRVMLVEKNNDDDDEEEDPLARLHLIDVLQRLGLSYHFEDQIQSILNSIHRNNEAWEHNNLHATALQFRLLREHGYWVPQEVFNGFLDDKTGNFKASLCEDTEGMLSLYEASYHLIEDENILEEATYFTTKNLKQYLQYCEHKKDQNLAIFVAHALELPLHWRMQRLETRWFIDAYESREDMNPILLELAKLDYNIVQSVHQEDLKQAYRWWKNTGIVQKLSFSRDRLVENFLWSVGMTFEPQFGYCRRLSTKNISLITTIDDIYDVYGTLDELELFTNAVERWDMNAMDQLPGYMRLCFLALLNSINEVAFDVLKQQELHIIKYLKKAWADLCKAHLKEAKWYHSGYTPSLEEYIENAWISISGPLTLVHAYFFVDTKPITQETLLWLEEYKGIIQSTSVVFRLVDDLGTATDELKRGDVAKSIQCYMHESGASEEEAREHIKWYVYETWKKMNKDGYADSPYSRTYIRIAMGITRMAHCTYLYGDGYGVQDGQTKHDISSLLIKPLPLI